MKAEQRINEIFRSAHRIPLTADSKLVLMSDCHRSVGNGADNFAKNQNLYYVALQHYDREGFCYIELGDGDELWENPGKSYGHIVREYTHIFELLAKLYRENRLHCLYGNHDIVKRGARWRAKQMAGYQEERGGRELPLFPGIDIPEGIVLQRANGREDVLLIHGHQVDFLNSSLWRVARLLVRYVWQPLELIGMRDPFSAVSNQNRRLSVEGRLTHWSAQNKKMLIAGHTHRPVFPMPGEALYFNDGSSVHPRHITAIEIENDEICMVKWSITTKPSGVLYVAREVLEGPVPVEDYFRGAQAAKQGMQGG